MHVLKLPFKDQKPKMKLLGCDSTYCFVEKTSRDYENETAFPFSKNFFRPSQSATSKPMPRKANPISFMA